MGNTIKVDTQTSILLFDKKPLRKAIRKGGGMYVKRLDG